MLLGLKDFWTHVGVMEPPDTRAEYLFWYFDAANRLMRTTSRRCDGDSAAIGVAAGQMLDTDASVDIYHNTGARVVYRGNPR
jgi:hypothetical protein